MSLHATPHLNAKRRRNRKAQLAARDGQRCTYCRRPFASLREATLDHVAPISLLRTWSADHLVLACRPCNSAKADRLPLSLALLLCRSTAPSRPTGHPANTVNASTVHAAPAPFTGPIRYAGWLALARLAHANESAARSARELHESTPYGPGVVGREQAERGAQSADCAPVRRPTVRPDCLRTPPRLRPCTDHKEVTA
ncbi:HNH endonuclease signature motif containing protein [Streptomyces flavidovirens]|uniref:HNH endonuclease n=1 Tax=Streptomyces flavidovirens TaxID=67298 RepID=UPI003422CC0C